TFYKYWLTSFNTLSPSPSLSGHPTQTVQPWSCPHLPPSVQLGPESSSADLRYRRSEESDRLASSCLSSGGKGCGNDSSIAGDWSKAASEWRKKGLPAPHGLLEQHMISVLLLTLRGSSFPELFASAVRSWGADTDAYNACFPYKSVHYLLTTALDGLRDGGPGGDLTVYWGTGRKLVAAQGAQVRTGEFILGCLNLTVAGDQATATLVNLTSSLAVDVDLFSSSPGQGDALLVPYERFRVEGVGGWDEGSVNSYALGSPRFQARGPGFHSRVGQDRGKP
uniref:NAD(P)(+)--arginine ADP-ribosyltransferase n=1 Tax=Callorhinchus milii TaxID=7868 RepID=A0A4W3GL61_CALMI